MTISPHPRALVRGSIAGLCVTAILVAAGPGGPAAASPLRPTSHPPAADGLGAPGADVRTRAVPGKVPVTVHDATNAALAPAQRQATATTAMCAAVTAGPGTTGTPIAVALSAAHNLVREFGVDSAFYPSDDALTGALGPDDALTRGHIGTTLTRYAAALSDTCAVPAAPAALTPARVVKVGTIAVVHPGSGPVRVPAGVSAAIIDLRGLPAAPGLAAALARAVAPFLARAVTGPDELVRVNDGPKDEFYAPDANVYSTTVAMRTTKPLPAAGKVDLPLALLTAARLAPAAARFAGTLRTERRAWLVGSGVPSAVAEMSWAGVGRDGIAVRTSALDHLQAAQVSTDDQVIGQDDPNDPTTAGYRRYFTLPADAQRLEVTTKAATGNDIDVYVLKDLNGDGTFAFPDELVAYSATTSADEDAVLSGLALGGHYELIVHGFSVPSGGVPTAITTSLQRGGLWPDTIAADLPLTTGRITVPTTEPPAVTGTAHRTTPATLDPEGSQPVVTAKPQLRAALIIAHGMVRRYWKYFDVEGDRIDGRLLETLASVARWNGDDRTTAFELLQRFGQALHDGHQFVFDNGPQPFVGYLPVFLDSVHGLPIVRTSADAAIHPGDTIESIDGRSTRSIYRAEYRLVSTATPGYRFDVASRYISRMNGPETLVLADPHGARRTVVVDPISRADWLTLQDTGVTDRASGPLTDLGAADLAYLNLNEASTDQIDAAIRAAQARHAKALVLDMRGYPGDVYGYIAARFTSAPFLSTPFSWNHFDGPDGPSVPMVQDTFQPSTNPHWSGPIVLLTGPHAVSAAESTMQMIVAYGHPLAVIGRRSAGTTGNLTGIELPGGFGFTYTGMLVRNVDGSRFMGVGIVPTISVPIAAHDLGAGIDRDLVTAVEFLHDHGL